jgi:predicted DNA repair protein MutK
LGAPRRSGLQAEVLASLAVVMVLASVVLGVVVVRMGVTHHETREARLRAHLTRSLAVAVRDLDRAATLLGVDAAIWTVSPGGSVQQRGVRIEPIDPESLALAAEAREAGSTLFRFGPADAPIRFAARRRSTPEARSRSCDCRSRRRLSRVRPVASCWSAS